MKQFVYQLTKENYTKDNNSSLQLDNYHWITSAILFLTVLPKLLPLLEYKFDSIKMLINILLKRKAFYCYIERNKIIHWGLVSFGFCAHYPINQTDAVIGPVNTVIKFEGNGLASKSLIYVLEQLFYQRQTNQVFIDTSEENFGMQRVIEKLGFGQPITSYERDD